MNGNMKMWALVICQCQFFNSCSIARKTALKCKCGDHFRFLLEYSTEGELSCLDLLENLGEEMLLSDRLTFLAKYRELLREKDSHKAAILLTALVDSQLAPHL